MNVKLCLNTLHKIYSVCVCMKTQNFRHFHLCDNFSNIMHSSKCERCTSENLFYVLIIFHSSHKSTKCFAAFEILILHIQNFSSFHQQNIMIHVAIYYRVTRNDIYYECCDGGWMHFIFPMSKSNPHTQPFNLPPA